MVPMVVGLLALTGSCRRGDPTLPAPGVATTVAAPPRGPIPAAGESAPAAGAPASSRVVVQLTEEGFVPSHIPAEVGKPITLAITRKTEKTCAREILFKGQPGKTDLPLNQEVEVSYTPKVSGTVPFGCAMGMMVSGVLEVR